MKEVNVGIMAIVVVVLGVIYCVTTVEKTASNKMVKMAEFGYCRIAYNVWQKCK